MEINQKKIWITGASSGIGKAVAEKFALNGWKVAVSARRKELLDKMSESENIFAFPCDVTDKKQVIETFNNIIKQLGNLDICLFSSGKYDPKNEKSIVIKTNKKIKFLLLYDKNISLQKKIKIEQLRRETK